MNRFVDVLPVIIMIESFAASAMLIWVGRYGSGLYWFSAGLLNFSVVFGVRWFG